jgi:hypothetical protein
MLVVKNEIISICLILLKKKVLQGLIPKKDATESPPGLE